MYNPLHCGLFLMLAFVLAGLVHSLWMKNRLSQALAIPLDGGLMFRGRPILGENKTVRGFVVMIPAAALAFAVIAILISLPQGAPPATLWQLTPMGYAALGAWAGFGFMAAEIPNSFVKRQLGILPGQAPASRVTRAICFTVDHIDSVVGMLAAVTLAVQTPWTTWLWVLILGPSIHLLFSWGLFRMGVKGRAA
ncbi:MAG TPA: CDP-archaeol synthase [Pyrinomonadaceae bacterium]|nr:CDP-archaeol synthase [Pyrinomonadaceae bacterium]